MERNPYWDDNIKTKKAIKEEDYPMQRVMQG